MLLDAKDESRGCLEPVLLAVGVVVSVVLLWTQKQILVKGTISNIWVGSVTLCCVAPHAFADDEVGRLATRRPHHRDVKALRDPSLPSSLRVTSS